jgi:hypothetical protein
MDELAKRPLAKPERQLLSAGCGIPWVSRNPMVMAIYWIYWDLFLIFLGTMANSNWDMDWKIVL